MVTSGKGEAGRFTQLPWLREQMRRKLGFDPYPGTLNVRIEQQDQADDLHDLPWVPIEAGEAGYCAARALAVEVDGRASAVWILPEISGYPNDQIELMADRPLRALLGLRDGDSVSIQIRDGVV